MCKDIDIWQAEVWQVLSAEYEGLEKWQRDEIYHRGRKKGLGAQEALRVACRFKKHRLPHIVFDVIIYGEPAGEYLAVPIC